MGELVASASVSLDGFIARADDSVEGLFDWYEAGDVEVANHGDLPPFHLTPTSAERWRTWSTSLGCLLVGRRLFDITDGWHGTHPLGVPVVVLTHEPPTDWSYRGSDDFHFVTDGVEAAAQVARQIAGDRVVGVAAGDVTGQLLAAGLLDKVAMDLVPIVLGSGKRYFGDDPVEVRLGDPEVAVPSTRVTHLVFPVIS